MKDGRMGTRNNGVEIGGRGGRGEGGERETVGRRGEDIEGKRGVEVREEWNWKEGRSG